MTDNTFTRVDPLMVHDALLYGPHRQDAADYACAALRAAYAEIDRLRASALEWVTVTDDPATLPEEHADVLILRAEYEGDPDYMPQCALLPDHEFPEWHSDFDGDVEVVPGDRWAYIPEVPHADN